MRPSITKTQIRSSSQVPGFSPGFGVSPSWCGHSNILNSFLLRDLSEVRKLSQGALLNIFLHNPGLRCGAGRGGAGRGRPWPQRSKSSSSSVKSPRMSRSAHRRWLRCWRVSHPLPTAFPPTRPAVAPGQFMTRVGSSGSAMRNWNPSHHTYRALCRSAPMPAADSKPC